MRERPQRFLERPSVADDDDRHANRMEILLCAEGAVSPKARPRSRRAERGAA
jgi:hypothetical protein